MPTKRNETKNSEPGFQELYDPERCKLPGYRMGAEGVVAREVNQMPYVNRKGKQKANKGNADTDDCSFSTSNSQRRGAGGRGSIARYGMQYLRSMDRRYAELTKEGMARRYKRMDRDFEYLYKTGAVDNLSPNSMTKEDLHNFLVYRMNLGLSNSEIIHEIAALKVLFEYIGSTAMSQAIATYPYLTPKGRADKLPSMDESLVQTIFEHAMLVDDGDWRMMKAYGVVVWALATGMRSKELRLCDIDDLRFAGGEWTALVKHPKGEGTYGKPRTVYVDPQAQPFMRRYLDARQRYVEDHCPHVRALFPGGTSEGGYMASNTARCLKHDVEKDIGMEFDLRGCRRTYGQRLIDRGVDIESVSKIMGHKNTMTTEDAYCSLGEDKALDRISRAYRESDPWRCGANGVGNATPWR